MEYDTKDVEDLAARLYMAEYGLSLCNVDSQGHGPWHSDPFNSYPTKWERQASVIVDYVKDKNNA